MTYTPRLKEKYEREVRPALMERFGYRNPHQAPRPLKVCVSMGVHEGGSNFETLERAVNEVAKVVGQRPTITRAKRSVANFGVRKGMPIGLRVTLRRDRMWEFLDRLFSIAIPRIRDFRGLPRESFDGRGNYSLGVSDLLIFPELSYDEVEKTRGMHVTIATSARSDEEGRELLERLGLLLRRTES